MRLVTVAVAIYNAEKYVATMIESIINQTYSNLEILLVDDGSTDGSLEICKGYTDSRVRVIHKENGGLSTARQCAIDNAEGEYICLVDADDYLSPQYIEKLYEAIDENCSDIAVCDYKQYDSEGYERIISVKHKQPFKKIDCEDLENRYYDLGVDFILSDSWNKMYRLSFLREAGIKFSMPREYNGTDWMFNYLLALHKPSYAFVSEVLYNYQILQTSRVRRKDKDLQSGFMIIVSTLLAECEKLNYTQKVKNQIYKIYCDLMRSALSDKFVNSSGVSEFSKKYKLFKKKFNKFNKEFDIDIAGCSISKGMKLFLLLMKLPSFAPMYLYLKQRKSFINNAIKSGD